VRVVAPSLLERLGSRFDGYGRHVDGG
jgi:hypothetical protein